jgi:hypothetical protein
MLGFRCQVFLQIGAFSVNAFGKETKKKNQKKREEKPTTESPFFCTKNSVLEFQLVFWKRNEEQQKNIPFSV